MTEKEFKLEDIFEQIKFSSEDKPQGKKADYPKVKTDEYCIGLTCAMTTNGNIGGYARREDCPKIVSNVISCNADGGTPHSFYHPDEISLLQSSWIVKLKNKELNVNLGLYLITCINKSISKYHYALKPGWNRVKSDKIKLPVDDEDNIDWEYMENYIEELKRECAPAYIDRLNNQKVNDADIDILNRQVEYKDFKIKDLFDIQTGDTDIQKKHINGEGELVVAAGVIDRGYFGRSNIEAKIFPANSLTIDMFGCVFFREKPYKAVTHNSVFMCIPKYIFNKNIGLYFETAMKHFRIKYNFGYKCNQKRFKEELIKLPVNDKGNPDYEYMDKYIQALRKQNESFVDRKINKLREFVGEE